MKKFVLKWRSRLGLGTLGYKKQLLWYKFLKNRINMPGVFCECVFNLWTKRVPLFVKIKGYDYLNKHPIRPDTSQMPWCPWNDLTVKINNFLIKGYPLLRRKFLGDLALSKTSIQDYPMTLLHFEYIFIYGRVGVSVCTFTRTYLVLDSQVSSSGIPFIYKPWSWPWRKDCLTLCNISG